MADKIFGYYDSGLNNGAIEIIAQRLPDNCTIVELGTFFGRSAICWAEVLRKLNKPCKIYTLDLFRANNKTVLSDYKNLYGMSSIWPFVLGECSHFEMVQRLIEPYPEIELVVSDFYNDPADFKNVDCVYYDGWDDPNLDKCIDKWLAVLNENGIYSGQWYHLPKLAEKVESLNMNLVIPKEDSTVYYLERKQ
jgi:hypothetical protein